MLRLDLKKIEEEKEKENLIWCRCRGRCRQPTGPYGGCAKF
jgi:hypothetical protein